MKPKIYMLCGAPAAGKSWVVNRLQDHIENKFIYVSYDNTPKKQHIELLQIPNELPKIYDPTFKISTIIQRHSDSLDLHPVFIYELDDVIIRRMKERGGDITPTITKRNKEILKRHKKYGGFIGTSEEVFQYLLRELGDSNETES